MGLKVGATWALIGFASQCLIAFDQGWSVMHGLQMALSHFLFWGVAGLIAGTVLEFAIKDSFHNTYEKVVEEEPTTTE